MTSTESKKRAACCAKCIEDGADGEVRRDEDADAGLGVDPRPDLLESLGGEPGGPDDRVDPLSMREAQIVHDDIGMGEVDDDLRARSRRMPSASSLVDADGELGVRGSLHTGDNRLPDLAVAAEHADPDAVRHETPFPPM